MSFDNLYNNFKIVEQEVKKTVTTTNLSDATVYAFLANQPNGSHLVHKDLEQIHKDDLEEIDLKWQLALLSMRARKYFQRTGKKITINGSDTAGYDKSKVECFNCHKIRDFAREYRSPRKQESRPRNQDSLIKTVNVEETSSKAMVAFDGAEVYNDKTCSNTCLKTFKTLKTQYDNLRLEFNKSEFDLATYKRGLAFVKEQLVFYKKNEVMFCDQIAVLKRDASFKDSEINALNIQIENLKKEKESNQIKIDNFENDSKILDKLIGSQISDNSRKGVGFVSYNAVVPPPTGLFAPPTIDLSNSGPEEFQQPEFEGYGLKGNKSVCENSSNEIKKTSDAAIIEEWVSDCDEDESEVMVLKSDNVQHKPEQENQPRKVSQNPRNNRTNWNEIKTQKLGVEFQFTKKACFVYGSFNHLIKDCDFHDKKWYKTCVEQCTKGNWSKGILTKSGIVPISAARQSSSRAAAPVSTARPINTAAPKPFENVAKLRLNVFQKSHSPTRRPLYQQTTLTNRNLNDKVNTAKVNSVNTTKGKRVTSAVGEQRDNAVKSSACWVWRPTGKVIDHVSKNSGSYICKQFDYVDPAGRLKYMTGNKSYLTDYQDYDGGFVAFADSSKGGKITGKDKIRTGKLDFEDVYFVKELKFILFSVSQMCDRKNNVFFTETECLILSLEFKLVDESLTCLFAKATNDESKLWHRRLGHINFKTMNKLVKGNLVRGLPSKIFENDHTCVACQKGMQHKATYKSKLVFFLAKKDETSGILKDFITGIENQLNHKVKIIRFDNGNEFKNYEMNQLYGIKGIKREFSNARTPQQNGVAERKNRTFIEAARTMLADSLLPILFWAEAVNTACYVHNRVLVTKPYNKTPYELLIGKFDGKVDEGFLVGYSINSKAFRVFNNRTRKVEENLHVNFLENKPNVAGNGPEWLFDIDSLTNSMNYQSVSAGNRTNGYAGSKTNSDAGQAGKEKVSDQEYILLPLLHISSYVPLSYEEAESSPNNDAGATQQPSCDEGGKSDDLESLDQQVKIGDDAKNINSTNSINTASPTVNVAGDKDGNFHSTNDELVFSTPIIVNAASYSFVHLLVIQMLLKIILR
ncbi:putative ribonuclease H-like domain-containing protein [Tanacetum coccineum]